MSEPDNIPADVMERARALALKLYDEGFDDDATAIAQALLSERQRALEEQRKLIYLRYEDMVSARDSAAAGSATKAKYQAAVLLLGAVLRDLAPPPEANASDER